VNLSQIDPGGGMKNAKKENSISTFLGWDASIEGTVEFHGMIRLDGNVKGKIFSNAGTVIVGEKAVIDAEINVDVAIVMGRVNGTIEARDRIEIYPPARVVGDIVAPVISIEAGVTFNGNCSMKPRIIQEKKGPDSPPKPAAVAEKKGK